MMTTTFTTKTDVVDWLLSRGYFQDCPGLDRTAALLQQLGHPERTYPTIHVAGTNGKGSTTQVLANLLQANGLRVGTFNSPFITEFTDQVAINGQKISASAMVQLGNQLRPLVAQLDTQPALRGATEFEILTALALAYFRDRVDVAIIEVGMGGLRDSTNVIQPELTAITTIGLDHTAYLGNTLGQIAAQKAGIIKPNTPIVVGNVPEAALTVIQHQAQQLAAPLTVWSRDYRTRSLGWHHQAEHFTFEHSDLTFDHLATPLIGPEQVENAAVALELYVLYAQRYHLTLDPQRLATALLQTRWPARMEVLEHHPLVMLDGAHNLHAIKRLKQTLLTDYPDYRLHILFSAIRTKNIAAMVTELLTLPQVTLTLTTFDDPRALKVADFKQWQDRLTLAPDWYPAYQALRAQLAPHDLLLITGSLYFASEVRARLKS